MGNGNDRWGGPFANAPSVFSPAPLVTLGPDDPLVGAAAAWFHTISGDRLRLGYLPPAAPGRGSVLLSTGRSESIEKYGEVAADLAARGFGVVLHEWAGQGLSGRYLDDRLRAHVVGGADRMLANLDDLLTALHPLLPGPWIAVAHSMGGGLTALALTQGERRFQAAVLCAPMIGIVTHPVPHWLVRTIAPVIGSLGSGARLARRQVDPAGKPFERNVLTHDRTRYERTRQLYMAHPELRLGEPTWAWVRYACDIQAHLHAPGAAERIACPVAIVAAEHDLYVDNAAMARFCRRLRHGAMVTVLGSYHEVLMETEERREQFWDVFDTTISQLLAPGSRV